MGAPCMDYKAKNRGLGDIDTFLDVMTELFCRFKLFFPSPSTPFSLLFFCLSFLGICAVSYYMLAYQHIADQHHDPVMWGHAQCKKHPTLFLLPSQIVSVTKYLIILPHYLTILSMVWYFINNGLLFFLPLRTAQLLHLSPTCNKICICMHSENFNCSDESV